MACLPHPGGTMQDYRKLDVWSKAHELAVELHRATARAAERPDADLASVLRRAVTGVPLRIVRACHHEGAAAFAQTMREAEEAVEELSYLVRIAHDAGALPPVPCAKLEARANQRRAMLGGFNRTVRRKLAGSAPAGSAARGVPETGSSRRESRR